MTPAGIRAQSIRNAARRDVTVNGAPALLVTGTQEQDGTVYAEWVLVAGDAAGVIIVNVTMPEAAAQTAGPALERAAMSLTWSADGPTDMFEGLGCTLDVPVGLPNQSRVGAALVLAGGTGSDRGTAPCPSPPWVRVRSGARSPPSPSRRYGRRRCSRGLAPSKVAL